MIQRPNARAARARRLKTRPSMHVKAALLGEGAVGSLLLLANGMQVLLDCSAAPVLLRHGGGQGIGLALPRGLGDALQTNGGGPHALLASSPYGLLGLPHLTAALQQQGRRLPLHIYCTEPCYHAFQQLGLELLDAAQQLQVQQQHGDQQQQQPTASQLQLYQQQMRLHLQQLAAWQQQQQQQQQQVMLLHGHGAAVAGVAGVQLQPVVPAGGPLPPPRPPPRPPPAPPTAPYPGTQQLQPPPQPPQQPPPQQPPPQEQPPPEQPQQQQQATARDGAAAHIVPLFTHQQLQDALNALQVVRWGQRLQLPGAFGLVAEARPAGCSIAHCMWLLNAGTQRLAWVCPASLWANPSAPFFRPALNGLDLLLLGPSCLCAELPQQLSPARELLDLAARRTATALAQGGCVLVPVVSTGVLYQLLEVLPAVLDSCGPGAAAAPLFYLSPVGPDNLATACSCCEFLEPARQQVVLAAGQAPFGHAALLANGRLRLLTGADRPPPVQHQQCQQQPDSGCGASWTAAVQAVLSAGRCVAFVPLWSMAAGPGALLARAWSGSSANLLLLPEQGPLTATWLQQCVEQQQLQLACAWQVLYMPCASSAEAMPAPAPPRPGPAASLAAPAAELSQQVCSSAVGACLTPGQLAWLLRERADPHRPLQLLLAPGDQQLLASLQGAVMQRSCRLTSLQPPKQQREGAVAGGSMQGNSSNSSASASVQWVDVQLGDGLFAVSLSKGVAKSLVLTQLPAREPGTAAAAAAAADARGLAAADAAQEVVSLARVRALLSRGQDGWRLDPLPPAQPAQDGGEGVQQSGGQQSGGQQSGGQQSGGQQSGGQQDAQQPLLAHPPELLLGSVRLPALLEGLRAAGFGALSVSSEAAAEAGSAEVTVVRVGDVGAAIRLGPGACTEVECDAWLPRCRLLELVQIQLSVL